MNTNTTSNASQAPAVSIDSEEFRNLLIAAWLYGDDPTHYTGEKDALVAHIDVKLAQAEARATAAEAKLEAIRQGVEKLAERMYEALPASPMDVPDDTQELWAIKRELSALIEPQPQDDESGLPG